MKWFRIGGFIPVQSFSMAPGPGLSANGLIDLADQRFLLGVRLQRSHRVDGVGCCRYCGRVFPCRSVEFGKALVRHYRRVLAAHGRPARCAAATSSTGTSWETRAWTVATELRIPPIVPGQPLIDRPTRQGA